MIFESNTLFTRETYRSGPEIDGGGRKLKKWKASDGGKLQEWTGECVASLKVCGGNLQTMTEKGEIFKNY